MSNLKRTQRIWAKVTSILLFHLFFTILVGYVSLKMSIFMQKQKQIIQQILTLASPFSPVREQIFSEILRKKSFSKVKNKSYDLSEGKNNMPVNRTIHKCKSNEYYSSNKENKPKILFHRQVFIFATMH